MNREDFLTHEDSPSTPQLCLCCRKPLTHTRRTVVRPTRSKPEGDTVVEELWDCTNQECITYRQRHPKIPTPPFSK